MACQVMTGLIILNVWFVRARAITAGFMFTDARLQSTFQGRSWQHARQRVFPLQARRAKPKRDGYSGIWSHLAVAEKPAVIQTRRVGRHCGNAR